MQITYYVATSLDGFICGENEDISGFVAGGSGVEQYLSDLQHFDTVVMGRKTYEFGYKFGLQPGLPAYPHMEHFIFSKTLAFENTAPNVHTCPMDIEIIRQLKNRDGKGIYLCGGGEFAGWLLEHGLIDLIKIKLNPLVLGKGTRLFGQSRKTLKTELLEQRGFDGGLQILTYRVLYD